MQAANDPTDAPTTPLGDLARHSVDYARTWSELFACEAQLARVSVHHLVWAMLWAGVLVLCAALAANAMVAAVANRWLQDWATALALTLLLNLAALLALLFAMRVWRQRLSLPRSRRARSDLLERINAARPKPG